MNYLDNIFFHNININKGLSPKINSTQKTFSKEKMNYYKPESEYFHDYNKNLRLGGNIFFSPENEKINKVDKKINQKHNSFNEVNAKKNYYRKSNHYNSNKIKKSNFNKEANNLNTINF